MAKTLLTLLAFGLMPLISPSAADDTAAAAPRALSDFVCNKSAFYPTAGRFMDAPGGTRHVIIPAAMCAAVATGGDVMQALCCANTRVNCSSTVERPTLVSYDGSHYPLEDEHRRPSSAETVLADADRRLCSMMMADKCADCDRAKCSLFAKAPAPKKCYDRTYTDKPDGSGWKKSAGDKRPVQPIDASDDEDNTQQTWTNRRFMQWGSSSRRRTSPPPPPSPAVSCLGSWGSWSACSSSCGGGGTQSRSYVITRQASNGGASCPSPQSQSCNTQGCPVDCQGSWGEWSACSTNCGGGSQSRSYDVANQPANGGAACPSSPETQSCNMEDCSSDCEGTWSAWGECSANCGGGIQSRSYDVANQAANGGASCPSSPETQPCNAQGCAANCEGSWNPWGACSASCGGGTRVRSYSTTNEPENGGMACPAAETEECGEQLCPVGCDGDWGEWSSCSTSCGSGLQQRSYGVTIAAVGEGAACPGDEEKGCDAGPCEGTDTAKAAVTLQTDFATLATETAMLDFKRKVASALSAAMGIDASRVIIGEVTSGSTRVEFYVLPPMHSGTDHPITWVVKDYTIKEYTADVGDTVTFMYAEYIDGIYTSNHNVYLHPSGTCDQTGATLVGGNLGSPATYKFAEAGQYTFACQVSQHCKAGQILTFTVGGVGAAAALQTAMQADQLQAAFEAQQLEVMPQTLAVLTAPQPAAEESAGDVVMVPLTDDSQRGGLEATPPEPVKKAQASGAIAPHLSGWTMCLLPMLTAVMW
jgi:plastocyanin